MGPAIWAGAGASKSRTETEVSPPENDFTYFAIIHRPPAFSFEVTNDEDINEEDRKHIVSAILFRSLTPRRFVLPEESDTEACYYHGARVTFGQPFDTTDDNGVEMLQLTTNGVIVEPNGIVLQPKRVEFIGAAQYGVIVEIGEDYVVLDAYDESGGQSGNLSCYDITPDTLLWSGSSHPFQEGWSCEMIVDNDVVLAMHGVNG